MREVNFNISRFRLRNTGIRAVHPPECRERGGNNEQNPYNRDEALTCVPADPFGERGVFLPCRATTSFSFSDGRVLLLDRLGHCAWQVVNCCRLTSGRRERTAVRCNEIGARSLIISAAAHSPL